MDPVPPAVRAGAMRALLPLALLLGLVGAILLAPSPSNPGVQLLPSVTAPTAPSWLVPVLIFGFVGVWIVTRLIDRWRGEPTGVGPVLLYAGVVGGIALVFDLLFNLVPAAPDTARSIVKNGSAPPNGSCTPPGCTIPPGGGLGGVGSPPPFEGALLYVVLIVAVVAAVLLIPRVEGVFRPRPRRPVVAPTDPAAALEEALDRLTSSDPGDDARRRIVRAYGELLRTVGHDLDRVDRATPRELAGQLVDRLGVQPATATEITALFEEARYSSGHPMPADAVDRAERALRRALEECRAVGAEDR